MDIAAKLRALEQKVQGGDHLYILLNNIKLNVFGTKGTKTESSSSICQKLQKIQLKLHQSYLKESVYYIGFPCVASSLHLNI